MKRNAESKPVRTYELKRTLVYSSSRKAEDILKKQNHECGFKHPKHFDNFKEINTFQNWTLHKPSLRTTEFSRNIFRKQTRNDQFADRLTTQIYHTNFIWTIIAFWGIYSEWNRKAAEDEAETLQTFTVSPRVPRNEKPATAFRSNIVLQYWKQKTMSLKNTLHIAALITLIPSNGIILSKTETTQ